jgi:DNA-binding winged helix-turn-helix (wHTH) protein/tetratricopeptide (TPR) repeat protein
MSTYEFGPFRLDAEQLLLMREGRPVALGPKVVETLLAFVERPGEVLAKGYLMDRIWPEGFIEEANLAQNVHVLRKTFREYGAGDPIETVPRRGYRFTSPLVPAPAARMTVASRPRHALVRRTAAMLAAAVFVAASLVLVEGYGSTHHGTEAAALSAGGERSYQIGRYYWNQRTRDGVQKSIGYFAQVIDTDPRSPRGYAALADANEAMGDYCYGTHRPSVYFARAREYARKALALDRNSAEAHAALGLLALHRNDMPVATTELRRALALDRSYGPAHEWYGIALLERGRLAEGREHLKIAAAIDPLSVATIAWLGKAAYLDRRYADAIAYSREALELSPRRPDVLKTIGESYDAQGEIDRAIATFKRIGAEPYYRPAAAALLARAYAHGHRGPEARAQLDFARAHAGDVDPAELAAAAAAVGARSAGSASQPKAHPAHAPMYV